MWGLQRAARSWSVKRRVLSVQCKWSVGCGMLSVKCGVPRVERGA